MGLLENKLILSTEVFCVINGERKEATYMTLEIRNIQNYRIHRCKKSMTWIHHLMNQDLKYHVISVRFLSYYSLRTLTVILEVLTIHYFNDRSARNSAQAKILL